jgi:hypothetical protein
MYADGVEYKTISDGELFLVGFQVATLWSMNDDLTPNDDEPPLQRMQFFCTAVGDDANAAPRQIDIMVPTHSVVQVANAMLSAIVHTGEQIRMRESARAILDQEIMQGNLDHLRQDPA